MADSTDPTDSAVPDGTATSLPSGGRMASGQRRVLWLVGLVAAAAIVLLAAWLVRMVSTERTLRAVTSSVTVAAAPAPTMPAPAVPAASPVPAVPAAPLVPVPPAVPATPALPQIPAAPPVPPAVAAAAAPQSTEARKPVRVVKSKNTRAGAKKEAKRRNTKAPRGTFARCPSLGKPGAVMCRWHICNGAAGKEAVCRPYLERRP